MEFFFIFASLNTAITHELNQVLKKRVEIISTNQEQYTSRNNSNNIHKSVELMTNVNCIKNHFTENKHKFSKKKSKGISKDRNNIFI